MGDDHHATDPAAGPPSGPLSSAAEGINDADRVAATARLQDLVAKGELSLERFSHAVEQVLAAGSQAELEAAMTGMPPVVRLTPSSRRLEQPLQVDTGMHPLKLGQGWQLASRTTITTGTGKCAVDLTAATWDSLAVDLHLKSGSGAIEVTVPKGVAVQMLAAKGDVRLEGLAPPLPGSPVLRVVAESSIGRIRFRPPAAPSSKKERRRVFGRRRRR